MGTPHIALACTFLASLSADALARPEGTSASSIVDAQRLDLEEAQALADVRLAYSLPGMAPVVPSTAAFDTDTRFLLVRAAGGNGRDRAISDDRAATVEGFIAYEVSTGIRRDRWEFSATLNHQVDTAHAVLAMFAASISY